MRPRPDHRWMWLLITSLVLGCTRGTDVSVLFSQSQGLAEGAAVLLDDVPIGEVDAIRPAAETRGIRVNLSLDPDKSEHLRQGAVAMIGTSSEGSTVEIYNYRPGANPLAAGDELIGLNSGFEYAAWRAGEAIDFGRTTVAGVTNSLQDYFASEEWRRQKQQISDALKSLENEAGAALGRIQGDYDDLIVELEAKSKQAGERALERYDALAAVIRDEGEKLAQQGQESATAALREILSGLEQAMKLYNQRAVPEEQPQG